MSRQELTPWFDGDVKPARVGHYELDDYGEIWDGWWDGEVWRGWFGRSTVSARNPGLIFNYQHRPWRGLAHPPKGKK